MDIDCKQDVFIAFLQLVNEFKEVREIEFDTFKAIFTKIKESNFAGSDEINDSVKKCIEKIKECTSYYKLITYLINKIDYKFLIRLNKVWNVYYL